MGYHASIEPLEISSALASALAQSETTGGTRPGLKKHCELNQAYYFDTVKLGLTKTCKPGKQWKEY